MLRKCGGEVKLRVRVPSAEVPPKIKLEKERESWRKRRHQTHRPGLIDQHEVKGTYVSEFMAYQESGLLIPCLKECFQDGGDDRKMATWRFCPFGVIIVLTDNADLM